jgi:hypothetical protein
MFQPAVLTWAIMQADTCCLQAESHDPASQEAPIPRDPWKVYEAPYWSFFMIERPAGSAHFTR